MMRNDRHATNESHGQHEPQPADPFESQFSTYEQHGNMALGRDSGPREPRSSPKPLQPYARLMLPSTSTLGT